MSGYKLSDGTDLSSIFQKRTDGITNGATETGFKDINGVDLVYKYIVLSSNIYPTKTGFKCLNGLDLNDIFEWGGFTTTVFASDKSSTFNTISFTITGNYYYISVFKKITSPISGATLFVPLSYNSPPYSYNATSLNPDTSYTFTIRAYNTFDVFTSLSFNYRTAKLIAPTVSLTSITGVLNLSYTIQFAYSGGDYTTCSIRSYTDNTYTSYTILGSIPYSNNGSFTTILDLDAYFIKFVPLDSDGNEGTPSTENSKSKNSVIYNYNYVTSESVYLPEFTYNLYYLVIGGGGSGGAGGGNGVSNEPYGGGGGGGGAGAVVGHTILNLTGSSTTTQRCDFTVGAPGEGVAGIYSGANQRIDGTWGKDGKDSTLIIDGIQTFTASKGFYGEGGSGSEFGSGGGGGRIGGVGGTANGGAGGAGGSTGYGNGNGSAGTAGVSKYGTSLGTNPGNVGLVRFTAYHF